MWKNYCSKCKRIDRENFTVLEQIGSGNFGTVNKSVVFFDQHSTICAIKVLRTKDASDDFHKEAELMRKITHVNVVRMFGLCVDLSDAEIFLLIEYCDLGDFASHNSQMKPTPARVNTLIIVQVADALKYQHSLGIIHRDIAARDELLQAPTAHNQAPRAKVAVLGLARETDENQVRWMAPETVTQFIANEKTDVWSFGVFVWEVLSDCATPFPTLRNMEVLIYLKHPTEPNETYLPRPDDCDAKIR